MDSISPTLKTAIEDASAENIEIATNHLQLNVNHVGDHGGTTLYVKMMGLSPELKQEFHRIKTMHNFKIPEEEQKAFVTVEFELKDINIDDVIK